MRRSKSSGGNAVPIVTTVYRRNSDDTESMAKSEGPWNQTPSVDDSIAVGKRLTTSQSDKDMSEDVAPPTVSIFKLFRFAQGIEWFLLFLGVLVAWGTGMCMPAMTILFGELTDSLVKYGAQQTDVLSQCFNLTNETIAFLHNSTHTISDSEFYDSIKRFGIGLSILGCIMLLLTYVMATCLNVAAERQVYRIRSLYVASILRQDIAWYDTHPTGEFASRTADDIVRLQDGMGDKIGMFNFFLSTFVLSIINAFVHGWKLTLVMLSVAPVMIIVMAAIGTVQATFAKKELQAYATAGAVAEEVLTAIRTVVAFGGEKNESRRYEENLGPAAKAGVQRGLLTAVAASAAWFIIYATYALAFWYGIGLIVDGDYTPSNFTIVFFSVFMGAMNIGQSSTYIESFSQARAAAATIFSIIDRVPDIDSSSEAGLKPSEFIGNVSFEDTTFSYPTRSDVPVLRGLDLNVRNGETVALVGESGCGKSTVVQLLQRFYDPSGGSVKLDGRDLRSLNIGWLRDHIGVVGQEPILFSMTIADNIRFGKEGAGNEDIEKAAKEANAHNFIMKLPKKYDTLVGERGAQLSGGQKQRVAIARALIKNPRILLLDEATSALDSESEAIVQAALDKARLGRTTIVVAHRLSTIRNADKIAAFSDGRIVEIGTHSELMAKEGVYCQLVTAQATAFDDDRTVDAVDHRVPFERTMSATSQGSGGDTDVRRRPSDGRKFSSQKEEEEEDEKLQPSLMKVLRQNKKEWKFIVLGCIGAVGMGFSTPIFSLVFGDVMGLMSNCDADHVRSESVLFAYKFLGIGGVTGVFAFLQILMLSIAGQYLTRRLRRHLFAAILRQEIQWFDEPQNSVGALCTRLSGDTASVQGATGSRIGTILQAFFTLGGSSIIALVLCWKLALVTMAFIPLVLASTYIQRKVILGQSLVEMISFERANKLAIEAISNVRTVASIHREQMFQSLYMTTLLKPHKSALRAFHLNGLIFGCAQCIPFFAYATSMFYGGYLVLNDSLDYASIFKVSQLLILGTSMVGGAFAFAPNYNKGMVAAARIFRLLERKPLIDSSIDSGLRLPDTVASNVRFQDVRFTYPSRPNVQILRGLNLTIPQGKVVALVGSSGCGKSTCVQLLERFYDPNGGSVTLEGHDIASLNIQWLRSQIGIVSQEPILFDSSISENIAYGDNSREVSHEEIVQAATKANVHKFITSLPQGYDTRVGDKGTQLSGGQKQRIAIARALLRNPKILLLDEATSALDTESERVVQEALEEAQKGRTCITVAHRLTTIKDADIIAVIQQGRVVELGSHDALIARRGVYHRFYHRQA